MAARFEAFQFHNAVEYHYGRFPPKSVDYGRLVGPLRRAATALARYDATLSGLHNKELLLAPLRHQEAVISSRIEGTIATLDEILTLEAEDEELVKDASIKTAYRNEAFEVLSYARALKRAQRDMESGLPMCGRLIRSAHRLLLSRGRGANQEPGEFKREQNFVVDNATKEVLFIPISPDRLQEGFAVFENFVNDEKVDPLIRTTLGHVEFEALHPFKDGNGRIGRIIITLMLWNTRLITGPYFYISAYLEDNRDEYISLMRAVSSHDQWTEWCIFFLDALEKQAIENLVVARKVMGLYEEMKERFRDLLSSQWSINALDYIFEKAVFRNSRFTTSSGIPKPTAARFTKILADNGLLKTVIPASGRRSAVYAFEPLLKVVRA